MKNKIKKSDLQNQIEELKKIIEVNYLNNKSRYMLNHKFIQNLENENKILTERIEKLENQKQNLTECNAKVGHIKFADIETYNKLVKEAEKNISEKLTQPEKQTIENFGDWEKLFPKSFDKFIYFLANNRINRTSKIWKYLNFILDFFDTNTDYEIGLGQNRFYNHFFTIIYYKRKEIYDIEQGAFKTRREAFEDSLYHLLKHYEKTL